MKFPSSFVLGLKTGIPIALGYFSVSVAYGMSAVLLGFTPWQAAFISFSNLTSAGQFAGTQLAAAQAPMVEVAVSMIVINARYILMALSLSQKLDDNIGFGRRLLMAYGITDEIFAAAIGQKGKLSFSFWMGLVLLPVLGWTGGTLTGALISDVLPAKIAAACGTAMYGMFIAILVPKARSSRPVLYCVLLSIAMSLAGNWLKLSSGWTVILVTVVCAGIMAWAHPEAGDELD